MVGSLQFASHNPNPIPGTGSIEGHNGSLRIGDDNPNPLSDMHQERRGDEIGGRDDIQILERNRRTVSYSSDEILWVICVNEL